MRSLLVLALYGWILRPTANGQFDPFNHGTLEVNQVRARLYSNGLIGPNIAAGVSDFLVPATDSLSPLYGSGLWMGGLTGAGQLQLAAHFNGSDNGLDFFPGPLTTDGTASITSAVSNAFDSVWVVHRSEVEAHVAYFDCLEDPLCDPSAIYPNGYQVPSVFLSWPAIGNTALGQALYLAPFHDRDNDGNYDPNLGDYPCVPGDEALYVIFNDKLYPHTLSSGNSIGAEVHLTLFGYSGTNSALDQTVFAHYRVIHRGSQPLVDFNFGIYADFDLGCRSDDIVGTDVGRNLLYVMNGDDLDEDCTTAGYGSQPPAFGIQVLQGPLLNPDGLDNVLTPSVPAFNGTGFDDNIIDNERHGMDRTIYFLASSFNTTMTDPSVAGHFYNYLKSTWKNSLPLAYGGDGYSEDFDVPRSNFAFPGNSDPNGVGTSDVPQPPWSETSAGTVPGDRRAVLSMGPVNLAPGGEHQLLIAYVYARAGSGGALASVAALQERADSIRAYVSVHPELTTSGSDCSGFQTGIRDPEINRNMMVYPNPATDHVIVRILGSSKATVELFDALGSCLLRHEDKNERSRIDLGDLPPGHYIIRVIKDRNVRVARFVKE